MKTFSFLFMDKTIDFYPIFSWLISKLKRTKHELYINNVKSYIYKTNDLLFLLRHLPKLSIIKISMCWLENQTQKNENKILHLDCQYVRKSIFDQFCTKILSTPGMKTQIRSMRLSNKNTCDLHSEPHITFRRLHLYH